MASSKQKSKILVVDDSPDTVEVLQRNLTSKGYRVFTAQSVPEAVDFLETTPVDLVITDYKMPKITGMDLIRHVHENYRDTEVMMITGYATVEGAVDAVKTGAEEYLSKPFTDEELFEAVERVLEKLRMYRIACSDFDMDISTRYGLIGESEEFCKIFKFIHKAATTSATALITGESGTGKELVARAIHYSGNRASAPFVPVNCGGIPENLLESELFGYVKGAFTGATESRAGFFQTADGGTIFLDEISETSASMQVKLLRVLQEKKVCMVGDTKEKKVDVRIIAATNKDLMGLVEKGVFREDVYFRINVVAINIPPLRKRSDDVLILAQHFAKKFANEQDRSTPAFSDEALRILKSYHWPGNVRELENVIQRLVIMTDGDVIGVPDLPSLMRFSALRGAGVDRTLAVVEIEHIRNVLASVDDNKTKAAEILGITRKTLREKLKSSEVK